MFQLCDMFAHQKDIIQDWLISIILHVFPQSDLGKKLLFAWFYKCSENIMCTLIHSVSDRWRDVCSAADVVFQKHMLQLQPLVASHHHEVHHV